MNYEEATEYLLNIPKFSKKTQKQNLEAILERLGNPQEQVKAVHVAGTNGKGSVCAFLNTMLQSAGKRTGLFTSPHLVRINERMRVDDQIISDEDFVKVFANIKNLVNRMEQEGYVHPSFFEFLFLMAVEYFAEQKVEYAIFEVGLGGRLDATNVLKTPVVSVITSISLDHTEILGNTLREIAGEKAGIIKPSVPVVFYENSDEAAEVIQKTAQEKKAPLIALQKEEVKLNKISSKQVDFSLHNRYYNCDGVTVNFPAAYQAVNCSLALLAFEVIRRSDQTLQQIKKPEHSVTRTTWAGRMEQVQEHIFFDGAHNLEGIREFMATASGMECRGHKLLLFGVVAEKDYEHMIQLITQQPVWSEIWITHIDTKRAASETEIRKTFEKYTDTRIKVFPQAKDAFYDARNSMGQEDLLFCAGSLYLVGELKKYLEFTEESRED